MKREINLFKLFLPILYALFTYLSFLDCIVEAIAGTGIGLDIDGSNMGCSYYETGRFFDNACWIILVISIIQSVLLVFKDKWIKYIRETLSLINALVTTVWPIYLLYKYPGVIGGTNIFVWTKTGYVVLVLAWFICLYNIIILRKSDKRNKMFVNREYEVK